MSWKKMDSQMRHVALQEMAFLLIGIVSGVLLGYFLPASIPSAVRYVVGFLVGWNVVAKSLIRAIAHRGVDISRFPRS